MLKTTSSENQGWDWISWNQEAQIRPFKSYPKNHNKNPSASSLYRLYCKKTSLGEGNQSTMTICNGGMYHSTAMMLLKEKTMHPPIFRVKRILRFSGIVSSHSKQLKIRMDFLAYPQDSSRYEEPNASLNCLVLMPCIHFNMCSTIVQCRWPDSK